MKSRSSVVRVTESKFADDVSCGTIHYLQRQTGASKWRLTASIEKTKGMAAGERLSEEDVAPIQV